MLFNSFEFAIFFVLVFAIYWFALGKKRVAQNYLLLVSSYVFYGWWDVKFLLLIVFSSLVDFYVSKKLEEEERPKHRKMLMGTSILVNIGLLGVFKYFNFFAENFALAMSGLGWEVDTFTLNVVLPVGISFYTFQTLGYTIDVYRKKLHATHNLTTFMCYVSFFPQLVAGPIERASNLLGQFAEKRSFDYHNAANGVRQILFGLFKKVVIADNCSVLVDQIFGNYEHESGYHLILGAILFSFQIYGDFSGYSDIAIGVARLFGFKLMTNFRYPYFSRDIAEFWRRWHISLSTWFRDYVYIPLGGSRVKRSRAILNTMIVFVVSGFWHGANWTFIFWGIINGLLFLPLLLVNSNRKNLDTIAENRIFVPLRDLARVLLTYTLVCVAWVFFRAEDLNQAISYLGQLFTADFGFSLMGIRMLALIALLVAIEWFGRSKEFALEVKGSESPWFRRSVYVATILLLFLEGRDAGQQFIYFQF